MYFKNVHNIISFYKKYLIVSIFMLLFIYAPSFSLNTFGENFGYTGNVQTFTAPENGLYFLEVWGAQGGDSGNPGGNGGYARGYIELDEGDDLYIYVGQQPGGMSGGWNGGGNASSFLGVQGSGGGGASDIRMGGHDLSDRIIVAGGGSGGGVGTTNIGEGGGLEGTDAGTDPFGGFRSSPGMGGTQSDGGLGGGDAMKGQLGIGGNAANGGGAGGGGGYYGGGGGQMAGGGGGSSYVGGVLEGLTQTGENTGDGSAVITLLGESPPLLNTEEELWEDGKIKPSVYDFENFDITVTDPDVIFIRIKDSDLQKVIDEKKDLRINTPNYEVNIPRHVIERDFELSDEGYKVFKGSKLDSNEKDEIIDFTLDEDPLVKNLSSIYEFKIFSIESEDSMSEFDTVEKFSRPLTIRLKDINRYGFERTSRTGVFYVEPEYDGEDLVDVKLFFTGNAYDRGDIVFTQDHFSFFVIRERDGFFFQDEQDVKNSFATEAIQTLASLGILSGNPNGYFEPNEEMNRTHFAIALNSTMGRVEGEYNDTYLDVQKNDYFAGPIGSLEEIRVNDSLRKSNFGVYINDDPAMGQRRIKRKEVAVFMYNAYRYSERFIDSLRVLEPDAIEYTDIGHLQSSDREAINGITQVSLMEGYAQNGQRFFNPEGVLTREQCAIVLQNFLKLYNRELTFRVDVN